MQERREQVAVLPRSFIRQCKRRLRRSKVADSTGADLTGGQLLMRTLIMRRLLRRRVLDPNEQYVGVLLPPSAAAVVVNAALALDRRIACNLNYTASSDVINECIELAGIRRVLTSRKFMERMNFSLNAEVVYLEDARDWVTTSDKLICAATAYAMPAAAIERSLGLRDIKAQEPLTVIFTSGSTGTPKGVVLTHANVASNAQAVDEVVRLHDDDVLIGILPFFHSFGYTISMWTVLHVNIKGVYHFSPLDAKQIGKLCAEHRGTILLATPTFLRNYVRRCDKEDFATLDVVVAGAEKLPKDLSDAFEQRFGVRPVEGYGTTELSPLVSVNIPASRSAGKSKIESREGSVGRPVPGVSAKITHVDTGETLGPNQEGMLWISGPNVMLGYLHRDDLTAQVLRDGWYMTGDLARIDEDGFIFITGRESRFSKIGGEMVPHIRIEEEINRLLGADEELKAVVTAVPDAKKGERLVVLHVVDDLNPDELRRRLLDAGLPPLYVPANDSFWKVDEIPVLGSGKLDLKTLKQRALELAARHAPSSIEE